MARDPIGRKRSRIVAGTAVVLGALLGLAFFPAGTLALILGGVALLAFVALHEAVVGMGGLLVGASIAQGMALVIARSACPACDQPEFPRWLLVDGALLGVGVVMLAIAVTQSPKGRTG
jgi:hypothetical protein